MAVGDNPVTLLLDRSSTTLITGGNGAGKSSCGPEGLSYALFGKSFRGMNKPALVNTVNQKACRVELDFVKNGESYRVIRGMKPHIFEIHKNGLPLDESSTVRDFQLVLDNIIGFSFNEFTKTIVLGNANYKPFLQLSAHDRRNFIESLLGLTIFTEMNKGLKARLAVNREEIAKQTTDIEINKEKYTQKSIFLKHLCDSSKAKKNKGLQEINDLKKSRDFLLSSIKDINDKISKFSLDALS